MFIDVLNLLLCNCYYSPTTRTHEKTTSKINKNWLIYFFLNKVLIKTMNLIQHIVLSWAIPAVADCIVLSVHRGLNFDSSFVKVRCMLTFYIFKACPYALLPPHMLPACLEPILHLWRGRCKIGWQRQHCYLRPPAWLKKPKNPALSVCSHGWEVWKWGENEVVFTVLNPLKKSLCFNHPKPGWSVKHNKNHCA